MSTRDDLQDLQTAMVELLLAKIKDKTATASDLKEANSLLGRNGILAQASDPVDDLAAELEGDDAPESGLANLPPPGTHYQN